MKILDFILSAMGSHLRILSRDDIIRYMFQKIGLAAINGSGCH